MQYCADEVCEMKESNDWTRGLGSSRRAHDQQYRPSGRGDCLGKTCYIEKCSVNGVEASLGLLASQNGKGSLRRWRAKL